MRDVRVSGHVWAHFFPNVEKLQLLHGSEESGAGVVTCRITLSQDTVEVASYYRVLCLVTEIVSECVFVETLSLISKSSTRRRIYIAECSVLHP